ncbi:MAG: DUF1467 family protein [Alphaproteobacteria bacterium]
MQITSGIVVFIMIWWSVIFCILPIGMSTTYDKDDENDTLQAPGAPKTFNLKKKLLLTTLISVILWCIAYIIIETDVFDIREWALREE